MSDLPSTRPDSTWRFDLTRIPLINRVLRWRPLQFTLVLITLGFFVLALLTAFFGTPAGNRNFSIIFVWIVWWTLGKRWPKRLRNIWIQNFAFLAVALFSAIILTRPAATGIVLLSFILLALGLSLVYERRTFCRYVCPIGGFIGLYSMTAPIELRVKDVEVCRTHDS
jgi:polyferredoxin